MAKEQFTPIEEQIWVAAFVRGLPEASLRGTPSFERLDANGGKRAADYAVRCYRHLDPQEDIPK